MKTVIFGRGRICFDGGNVMKLYKMDSWYNETLKMDSLTKNIPEIVRANEQNESSDFRSIQSYSWSNYATQTRMYNIEKVGCMGKIW